MKTFLIIALLALSTFGGQLMAQTGQTAVAGLGSTITPDVPPPTAFHVVAREANRRVWQRETYEKLRNGQIACHTNSYTELASGLHYKNAQGEWVDSQEVIEPFSGGAVAAKGQFRVIFADDLNTAGAIDLETPDGKRLRSNILALDYCDRSTGRREVIATVQDSQGGLMSANQVLYPNAFNGVKADVRYTYRKGSFEQDVVLKEQLPTPEFYGLNAATTELEVITEFLNPPDLAPAKPHKFQTEQEISWGTMLIGHGKAFEMGDPGDPVTVQRQYTTIEGRQFLFETLPLRLAQTSLSRLPLHASIQPRQAKPAGKGLPKPLLARRDAKPMKVASAKIGEPAYVLDYVLLNADPGAFTFQGDVTYYISDHITFYDGKIVIEGGAVLKHNTDPSVQPLVDEFFDGVECDTAPYRPAIFTSINDNSVGESLYDPGKPLQYYWGAIAGSSSSDVVWHDLQVKYCHYGIDANHMQLHDCQFVDCLYPILQDLVDNGTCSATNVLIENAAGAFTGISFSAVGYQVTVNNCTNLTVDWDGNTDSTLALTNSLLVNVQALGDATLSSNYTAWVTDSGGQVLQTVGAGSCYLVTNSPYRSAGTTNLDPTVLNDMAGKTTYPPIVISNTTISVATTYSPQAQRDNQARLDIGYHYDPLDYVFGGCTLSANLGFNPGTAIGWFKTTGSTSLSGQPYGICLNNGASFNCSGTATAPCWMVSYNTVQEGGTDNWPGRGWMGGLVLNGSSSAGQPAINTFFTKFSALEGMGSHWRDNLDYGVVGCTHCEFYSLAIASYRPSMYFTNCLFYRLITAYWDQADAASFTYQNCTFYNGGLVATRTTGQSASFWAAQDTAFDGTAFQLNDNFSGGTNYTYFNYNAYNTNNLSWQTYPGFSPTHGTLETVGPNDLYVTNFNWETSWFGAFYLPTNSPLINVGSTTADQVQLYHFTVETNQIPETNSVVDIGYHYVATDANGNPLDTNGDGIPDYLEDANGNGLDDSGEIGWNIVGDLGLKVIISRPRNGSSLP